MSRRHSHTLLLVVALLTAFGLMGCPNPDPGPDQDDNYGPYTWTKRMEEPEWGDRDLIGSVVFNNKIWVLGGTIPTEDRYADAWNSPDGVHWSLATDAAPWGKIMSPAFVVHNGEIWLIGGIDTHGQAIKGIWHSPDGVNWTQVPDNPAPWATDKWTIRGRMTPFVFQDKIWAVGFSGEERQLYNFWFSDDGIEYTLVSDSLPWTNLTQGELPRMVVFDNKIWAFANNKLWFSSNGSEWTSVFPADAPWGQRSQYAATLFDGKIWIAGGMDASSNELSDVWSSSNGSNWTQLTTRAPWQPRNLDFLFAHSGKLWMLGGDGRNDLWNSVDGSEWTQVTDEPQWKARTGQTSVVLDDRLWILGGSNYYTKFNDVWSYDDLNGWVEASSSAPWSKRTDHASVAYDGKMWVFGGLGEEGVLNDVWYSEDGANWTQATNEAPWVPRYGHEAAVFKNRIYVLGGKTNVQQHYEGDEIFEDIWWTVDGVNWTQEYNLPRKIFDFAAPVFQDKLWLVSGGDGYASLGSIWYSSEGRYWTEAPATFDATFLSRIQHTCVTYDGKLWLMGGTNHVAYAGVFNDVWYSENGIAWSRQTLHAPWFSRAGHSAVVYQDGLWICGGNRVVGAAGDQGPASVDVWEMRRKY